MPDNLKDGIGSLLDEVTEIIKETGFASIEEFPKLFTSTTPDDSALEAVFCDAAEHPQQENLVRLASALNDYIELDDINMGLMASCAAFLKERCAE